MQENERRELRNQLAKQYLEATGYKLILSEDIQPISTSTRRNLIKKHIFQLAAKYLGIEKEEVLSYRKPEYIEARQMIVSLLNSQKMTFTEIAEIMGYKQHGTAIHAVKRLNSYSQVDKEYKAKYRRFKDLCYEEAVSIHQSKDKPDSYKLMPLQVKEIRSLYLGGNLSLAEIGKQYNVQKTTVWQVVNRKTWKHIK